MKIFRYLRANRKKLETQYGKNSVFLYQAIFLSQLGRSFAFALLAVHSIILFPGTPFMDTATKLWLAPFIAVLVCLMMGSAWLAEAGKIRASRYMTNSTISVAVVLSVILCGGFIDSHATPFLFGPIVVSFCISPRKEAFVTSTLTFFIPLGFDLLARMAGWNIPNLTSTANPGLNVIFLMTVLFLTILIALDFLQHTNNELHSALEAEKKTYRDWASLDPLTGIGNRRHLDLVLEQEIFKANDSNQKLAVLFLDLDGFKAVNDELGHEKGDDLLRIVAKRLQNSIRKSDQLARLGGDEFAIVLPAPANRIIVEEQTARLKKVIGEPVLLAGTEYRIGASIGKAMFPADAENASDLLRAADMDMYSQKLSGKNSALQTSANAAAE